MVLFLFLFCSINQGLDVGQLEGAFVMGIGYLFTENILYDPESGRPLSTSTWVREIVLLSIFELGHPGNVFALMWRNFCCNVKGSHQ